MSGAAYADSSALVKLIRIETGTVELVRWIQDLDVIVTSEIADVEVRLAARRALGDRGGDAAEALLANVQLVDLSAAVRTAAGRMDHLRALDAIHLASALATAAVADHVICYDRRLGEAARAAGLRVESPGAPTSPTPG